MSATYRKRKRSYLVTVHAQGQREYKSVRSEQDAKELVRYINKQELAGINVIEAIRKARATVATVTPEYPALKDALPAWLDAQVAAKEIRASTGALYQARSRKWVYAHALADGRPLGELRVNEVTREHLGAVITKIKTAGLSRSVIEAVQASVRRYYATMIQQKALPGPNPADDLTAFIGKAPGKRAKAAGLSYFDQELEIPKLIETAKALHPEWSAFIMTGLLAGLRWGESASLFKTDVDLRRSRIHVQRTVSKRRHLEPPKDGEGRYVAMSPKLRDALAEQIEKMDLEGQVKKWTPEQRLLVFPNKGGGLVMHSHFSHRVWRPLLKKAGLPYRKFHATRHSYATTLLESGTDLRYVQRQLGHASIQQTVDTYGHLAPERHEEAAAKALDRFLS